MKNNRGMYSVELSILFPIIIIAIMLIVYAFLAIINREKLRSNMCVAVSEYSNQEINEDYSMNLGTACFKASEEDGTIRGEGSLDMSFLGYDSRYEVSALRDSDDALTKRLRRFQVISDIKE